MIHWLRKLGTDSGVKNLGRGIMLAATVGAVAGLGAMAFQLLTHVVSYGGLGLLGGYEQGVPKGEHALFGHITGSIRLWMLVALPVAGGLISGFLVFRYAPEAEGHGTDAAIDAYHNKRGQIRGRVPLIKMLSSAITMARAGPAVAKGRSHRSAPALDLSWPRD